MKTLQLSGITNLDVFNPCNLDHLELTIPNYHSNNNLMLLHQNIRSLNHKNDEFSNFTSTKSQQVLCYSEHHLNHTNLIMSLFRVTIYVLNFVQIPLRMGEFLFILMIQFNFLVLMCLISV